MAKNMEQLHTITEYVGSIQAKAVQEWKFFLTASHCAVREGLSANQDQQHSRQAWVRIEQQIRKT
jgi:hypothetical protein